jgi:phospholipid/cholesterol/gamma-HCH transport system substrate-binding protein
MKVKIRFAEQIVGIFVLIAIVGVAVILIFIGINQRWFAKNYTFRSRFDSASGLSVGMPITLQGFEIGAISRMSLNASNKVDILFFVQDTYYEKVRANSVLELASSPIGLGTTLKFHPGRDPGPPQEEMSFIPSLDSEEGRKLLEKDLVEIPKGEDVIGSVIAKVNPILDEVRTTIIQIKRIATTVDAALNGGGGPVGTMVTDLSGTPAKVNRTIDDVTVRVNTLLDRLAAISDNLQDVSLEAKTAVGDLSGNLEEISQNIKEMTADLKNTQGLAKRLLDPKGSIDTFLNDQNELYSQVDSALKNANEIVAQIRSFIEFINGTKPQITGILERVPGTLDQGKDVLEAVKNNPLLKGGVPERREQPSTLKSYRNEEF